MSSNPRKPDLDRLVTALTADGRPDELAGREAALAAFRAAGQRDATRKADSRRRGATFRRPLALRTRLAAIGAAVVVVGGAAAAYAQALPGPVQQLAHTVFAPLGVQGGQPPGTVPGTGSTGITIASTGGKAKKASPGTSVRTPTPRPGDSYVVTVAVSRSRVPAQAVVTFTGRVTDNGRAAAGLRVRLYERVVGTATERLVATGVTGPRGGFRLVSPPLAMTSVFRVVGPDAAHSVAVRIAVAARSLPPTGSRSAGTTEPKPSRRW